MGGGGGSGQFKIDKHEYQCLQTFLQDLVFSFRMGEGGGRAPELSLKKHCEIVISSLRCVCVWQLPQNKYMSNSSGPVDNLTCPYNLKRILRRSYLSSSQTTKLVIEKGVPNIWDLILGTYF